MAIRIPLSELAKAIDRPESLIRIAAKSRAISIEHESVSLPDMALIVRIFAGSYTDETADMHQLLAENEKQAANAAALARSLEKAKSDNSYLMRTLKELRSARERAEARADRMESMLHDVSKSLAHLVDQRDRIVDRYLHQSRAVARLVDGKEVLLLCDPVA